MAITEKIKNKVKYFALFKYILKRDFKSENSKRTYIKITIIVLFSLIAMLLSTFVFSGFFTETVKNYPLFFFCGETVFLFLFGSAYRAMDLLKNKATYIQSVYMPKNIFVLSSVFISAIPLILYMALTLLIMLFTSAPFSAALLMLPLLIVLMVMFAFGFSLILAAYKPIIKSLNLFYLFFSLIWLLTSPVFYPLEAIPEKLRFIFYINPAVHYMEIMRTICCFGSIPPETSLIRASVYSILVMLLGISVFKAKENKYLLKL